MIKVQNLTKRYGDQTVVNHISFEVAEKEIFGLLGPNGAGKTTTMEMMEGLRKPDGGSIEIAGFDAIKHSNAVKSVIGVQLQSTALFDHINVRESIKLYASFYPHSRPIAELLHSFNLEEKEKTLVKHLSGGQRQRLAIALAVVHDPRVIFLDEPTTGLDPQARRNVWEIVRRLRDEGRTVFLSTHYMEEAEVLCDRVAIMDRGNIMAIDSPAGLIRQLASDSKVEFLLTDQTLVPELKQLAGVKDVSQAEDGSILIHTDALPDTLSSLIPWANSKQIPLTGLRTRTATLEDVFLELTGKRLIE